MIRSWAEISIDGGHHLVEVYVPLTVDPQLHGRKRSSGSGSRLLRVVLDGGAPLEGLTKFDHTRVRNFVMQHEWQTMF